MTYCVGMMLNQGLVFMSDTRTNAGLDNISTFKKMHIWENPEERVITLLSAGNLATTQSVVSLLEERSKAPECRNPTVLAAASMFQVAQIIASTLKEVIQQHSEVGQSSEKSFDATMILGGQIQGGPTRLFLIYPEGNFIEAGPDTPFFQIGEIKYGRPILVRAYHPALDFRAALRLILVSFDSTLRANLTVGAPFDYHCYEIDTFIRGPCCRIESDDPRFVAISDGWSDALKRALEELPDF